MRKLLILAGFFMFLATPLIARVDSNTMDPVVVEWNNDGVQIINSGNDGSTPNVLNLYVVGGATSTAASFWIGESSLTLTTVGGLNPGSTNFLLTAAAYDTLTELAAYLIAMSTSTPGADGGVVCSTSFAAAGPIVSSRLTDTSTTTCLGSSNAVDITATPVASQTSTVAVFVNSMTFVTTNGLYPGTTNYHFTSSTETIADLEVALEAFNSTDPGIDGTLTLTIPNGSYELNKSSDSTAMAATSILTTLTLDLDTTYGISYTIPAGISRRYQWHITGITANATFGSGTTYLRVYDGIATTDTLLLKYEIDVTATETPIKCIPTNGDFAGGKETRLRFDLIGSAAVTAGHLSIIGHKE